VNDDFAVFFGAVFAGGVHQVADDRLAAFAEQHMLDGDLLLARL
jgi:hypothetical protein